MEKLNGTLLVGYSFGDDANVLIVGQRQPKNAIEIINAFQGDDARALYEMLTTKKEAIPNDGKQ